MYSIGIDIGHSILKLVVLNCKREIVYKEYIFHHGGIANSLKEKLNIIREKYNLEDCYIGITGNQGKDFSKNYINDISATTEGVLYEDENIQSIIEIGAQSARFITNFTKKDKSNIKFSMNSSCSAGTGSFLEEQVSRLGIKLEEYSEYVKKATYIPRIAGRCSVFSKTDMIHHQQEGTKTEDILLGLSYALVRNYKANVVQRINVKKPVMFIGGVAYNQGVVDAIKDIFKLSDKELATSNLCIYTSSLGAACIATNSKKIYSINELLLDIDKHIEKTDKISLFKPLLNYGYDDSINKHICKYIDNKIIEGYLGIDIGSTSTNLVLINSDKQVLSYRYLRTKGNPSKVVDEGLESIKSEFKDRLNILGIGTTGSGRKYIGDKINANVIINEITAQAKGAVEIDDKVDTVFEIGGQDSKYIRINDGRVIDFEMNKVCAAGTGSFIEEQAKKMDINIEDYEQIALKGQKPLNLGDRCTVFIEGNISKALAQGNNKEDITAGLSYSIVNNYLNKVVANKPIGNKIFLQGGIAHNQAVVNAFRAITGKEVIVPPFFSVTGAYGVALLALEDRYNSCDKMQSMNTRCIKDESKNLFLEDYKEDVDNNKLTIGIPRVLFIHKIFPLFDVFFRSLGFNVILSDETNEKIVALSQEYSLDETCYPIKLVNGHVATLIEKKVDYIFLPSLYTMKHPVSKVREDYACVYMQSVPKIVSSTMNLGEKGIELLSPALSFRFGKQYMMETMMKLGKKLGKNKVQTSLALAKGMKKLTKLVSKTENIGKSLLNDLGEDEKVFVIITRAYGVTDKGLNMEIPKRLRDMGYRVITLSHLEAHNYDLSADYPNMYWPFGQHILSGAKIVKQNKNMYAIYLTNHGCGPDTILSHYFKKEMGDKPYLHIEVDEHASNVGVLTRLEAFVESIKNRKYDCENSLKEDDIDYKLCEKEVNKTLYIPNLYPYSQLICKVLRNKGIKSEVLDLTNEKSLEIGRKHVLTKEYLSLTALLGDALSQIDEISKNNGAILIPQSEGSETFGQYGYLLNNVIKELGYKNVCVNSPFFEDILEKKEYGFDIFLSILAGDLIMISDKKYRDKYLENILDAIENNKLSKNLLIKIAEKINKQTDYYSYKKSILAIGELPILFNPMLNQNQLIKLEKNNRVYYEPVSEVLYFELTDYLNKEKTKHLLTKNTLDDVKSIMKELSNTLGKFSPFDENIDEMFKVADKYLKLYRGGNGRYRISKMIRGIHDVDGILHINSMYENTGIVLKILREQSNTTKSVIDLTFDGSSHSMNDDKIQNFIYYI